MCGVWFQVRGISIVRPQKIMIFRQISFQPGDVITFAELGFLKAYRAENERFCFCPCHVVHNEQSFPLSGFY